MKLTLLFLAVICGVAIAEESKRVVCYWNSWAHYRPGKGKSLANYLDPTPCTHYVYNTAKVDSNLRAAPADPWNDLPDGGGNANYRKLNALKQKKPTLKTLLAIGGWNTGSAPFSHLSSFAGSRREFIDSAISLATRHGFNGILINWMYPTDRGGRAEDRENFVELLKELYVETQSRKLELGVDLTVLDNVINNGYDIPQISKNVDFMTVVAFDYHGSWSGKTGHVAPLHSEEDGIWGAGSVHKSLQEFITAGADKSKLVLAITTLGRTWTVYDPDTAEIGSVTSLPGSAGPYTQQAGALGFNEICEDQKLSSTWVVKRPSDKHRLPVGIRRTLFVSYEDADSAGEKAAYAKEQGLGGVAIYSTDTDDFGGVCGKAFPITFAASQKILT